MYKNKRILALVPARSGSKRLPGKNTLIFNGKPLLAWSIEHAKRSQFIDLIVVSTDSKKIAKTAKKFNAEAPFLRPKKISGTSSKTVDVIFHAVDFLNSKGLFFDYIILLQPTSPLRAEYDIDEAIKLFFNKKAQSVISVCKVEHNPSWSATLTKSLSMKNFINTNILYKRKHGLPGFYRINGSIYFSSVNYLRKNKGFLGDGTIAYLMPKERSIDIDDEIDFMTAELLVKNG